VLLVEGDADTRAVLQTSLERCGYRVTAVSSGAQGVAAARQSRPAAVVLDLVLEDISGYDVLRILKNSPDTATVPVLVLSVDPDRELARQLGAWSVVQKPLDLEAVQASLMRALRRADHTEGRLVLALGPAVSRDLSLLASALEADGYRVHRALDVSELARWASSNYPDAVVLDADFLGVTPHQAAELLGHADKAHSIALVFLTTDAGDDGEIPAGSINLRKPISKEDVIGAVNRMLTEARDSAGHAV
jgi:DNA-binding response OmpR family regulator